MGWAYMFDSLVGRNHIGVQINLRPSFKNSGIWAPIGQVSIWTWFWGSLIPLSFSAFITSLFSRTAFMAFFDSVLNTGALAFSISL